MYSPPPTNGAPLSNTNGTVTDTENIVSTIYKVDQKSGAGVDTPPNQPVADTTLTAVDGLLTTAGSDGDSPSRRSFSEQLRRQPSDYELMFSGTGTGTNDCDASMKKGFFVHLHGSSSLDSNF